MTPESERDSRIGKLEVTLDLYKPIFKELRGIFSVVDSMDKIQEDLQFLRESRIKTKEKLITLLKEQDRLYKDTTEVLQDREKLVGVEVTKRFGGFELRLEKIEESIDSFKSKGWETLSRIVPWVVATGATLWVLFR